MNPWVIKIGGAALSNAESLKNLAQAILLLKEQGEKVVIVHGGGPVINQRLTEKEISWEFFEGQRITTAPMMNVIESAMAEVNRMICNVLTEAGIKNVGISGSATSMFLSRAMHDFLGRVGEVYEVNTHAVEDAHSMNLVPVIAPIGTDLDGLSYNINADFGASTLASALKARILIFATDQRGILDVNGLPYDSLTLSQLKELIEKEGVTGGMLVKSRSIEKALSEGVKKISVIHALELSELIETRFGGTLCVEMGRLESIMKLRESHYAAS